jgi:hypothetical protein
MRGHGDAAAELNPGPHLGEDVGTALDLCARLDHAQAHKVAHLGRRADLTLVRALVTFRHRLAVHSAT